MGSLIGAWKTAAGKAGVPVDSYLAQRDAGEKFCMIHRAWHPTAAFSRDATRGDGLTPSCRDARNAVARAKYQPRVRRPRLLAPTRDGDKRQARSRVNAWVRYGRLPNPNTVACADCGHLGSDRRHEYDHHAGYGAEHQFTVQVVCTSCHHRREWARRRGAAAFHPTSSHKDQEA